MARKLVVVNDNVRLVELGNIYGPISTPTRIPLETIRTMCVKNRDVWECDPSDPRNREKRVKLTLSNYGEAHFGVGEKKGIENYSYVMGGVNKDAMDHFEPAHAPVEEKKEEEAVPSETVEPEVPAEDPVEAAAETGEADDTVTAEEAPVPESAEPETKEEAAPVVDEKAPANQQNNSQNHGGKKNKKGR